MMVNNDVNISSIKSSTTLPVHDIAVPGHDNTGGRVVDCLNSDDQRPETTASRHEPPSLETTALYDSIIDVLLQHCEQDSPLPQDSAAPQVDRQNRLLRFLGKIPGCFWLHSQFGSGIRTSNANPSHPQNAVQPQNGQCAACQGDWSRADRFCTDLAIHAREMQLEWGEVESLVAIIAQQIVGPQIHATETQAQFTAPVDEVDDLQVVSAASLVRPNLPADATIMGQSAENSSQEQEIVTPEGFAGFYRRRHLQLIHYFLNKHLQLEDAQDLTQETILRLWQRRHESMSSHRTFMFKIALDLFFAFLRSHKIGMVSLAEAPDCEDTASGEPLSDDDRDDLLTEGKLPPELLDRIDALSQKQRKVIRMIYIEGLSLPQTAAKMGITKSSVRVHVRRAKATLKGLLAQKSVSMKKS